LGDDAVYDTTLDIYQSDNGVGPFPNFNDAVLDSPLFAPGSTVFHQTNATFVATTTGFVVLSLTTSNPSGISTVQWRNLSTYEMGVSLENATYPSLTADRVAVLNDRKQLVSSAISITKLGFLDNVSSDIQTQLNARVLKAGDTMTGTLDMGAQKVTTTYVPVNPEDVITKGYGDATYATSSALSGYLPLTGGTLTGNFTVSTGNDVSLVDGLTVSTNTRATTASLSGSTINGTHVAATITTLPSPPPVYNITYSGSFSGGLTSSFFPTPGLTYRYTFTNIWRQGLPGGILTVQFLQNVSTITGLVGFPLTPTISITPTSYATATTITGTFTPPQAGALFLSFFSVSVGATSFYWDDFSLTDITASVTAPLSLTKPITQPINSSAEFAGGLQVAQYDLGLSAAGFITTGLPTGLNGGTLSGPTGSFYRLTALAGQADMAMRPSLLAPLVGERYTYVFRGIRSSVPLTLQVIQSVSVNVISTQPFTNNITTELQDITGSFISANNTTANAFRFSAGSADPWVEWATFSLFRSDTNVRGLLTVGGNTSMLGNATVAGTASITGNTTMAGTASITGNTTMAGTASITGNTTMAGTATIGSTLRNVGTYLLGDALTPTNGLIRMVTVGGVNFIQSGLTEVASSSADLVFGSIFAGNEWMRIKADGKVGIGTNAPSGRLTIYEATGTPPSVNPPQAGLVFSHGNTNGTQSILFTSANNFTSDFGFIQFIDTVTVAPYTQYNYFGGSGAEVAALVIGCQNDGVSVSGPDSVIIASAGIVLDPTKQAGGANGITYIVGNVGVGTTNTPVAGISFTNNGTGLNWGNGFSRIVDDAQLRICTDDQMFFQIGCNTGSLGTAKMLIDNNITYIYNRAVINGTTSFNASLTIRDPVTGSDTLFGEANQGDNYIRGRNTYFDSTPVSAKPTFIDFNTSTTPFGNGALQITAFPGGLFGGRAQDAISCRAWNDGNFIVIFHNTAGGFRGCVAGVNSSSVAYLTSSDRRLKDHVHTIEDSLRIVNRLNPVHFRWIRDDEWDFGFIAQDVYKVLPHMRPNLTNYIKDCTCKRDELCCGEVCAHCQSMNDEPVDENGEPKYYSLDYGKFTPYLVGAVKELSAQVEVLQAREAVWVEHAKQQEATIEKLRADVEKLAGLVAQLLPK
jgi:hypothetical protein